MRVVMVGVDGSPGAQVAVRYAVEFAHLLEGGVRAIAIAPRGAQEEPEPDERSLEKAVAQEAVAAAAADWFARALAGCAEACAATEVEYDQVTLVGAPAHILTQQAESADLVVVGAHGRTNDPSVLLGGTTRALLRSCIKPMLIARAEYRPVSRALVGYDGSPTSGHAVATVADLAAAAGWQVCLVTGAPDRSELAEGVHRAAKLVRARGVEPEVRVLEGDGPSLVFDAAQDFKADLVAIGGPLRGTLSAFFFGESWPDIVEQAKTPVLL